MSWEEPVPEELLAKIEAEYGIRQDNDQVVYAANWIGGITGKCRAPI